MRRIRTDSTFITRKIDLRREGIAGLSRVAVLDCFGGNNTLWRNVRPALDDYYSIEIIRGKGVNVLGNNRRIIPSLDLSRFTVVDLDSYGIPYAQLKALFENGTLVSGTVVFVTCILSKIREVDSDIKKDFSVPDWFPLNMAAELARYAIPYLLKKHGVEQVTGYALHQKSQYKQYYYFTVP